MAQSTYTAPNGYTFTFNDDDIVNPDDYIPDGEYNPHHVHPIIIHSYGSVLAVVFASDLQEALDVAADDGRLEGYMIKPEDYGDYCETDEKTGKPILDTFNEDEQLDYLGNASEPFDLSHVGWVELPNPKRSFCAQFNASEANKKEKASK